MVIHSTITSIFAIPNERIANCDFIIITHYLPNTSYVFENDLIFKKVGNILKPIATYMSGRCRVIKINKNPKSLTWLKANRKPKIEIFITNLELCPF